MNNKIEITGADVIDYFKQNNGITPENIAEIKEIAKTQGFPLVAEMSDEPLMLKIFATMTGLNEKKLLEILPDIEMFLQKRNEEKQEILDTSKTMQDLLMENTKIISKEDILRLMQLELLEGEGRVDFSGEEAFIVTKILGFDKKIHRGAKYKEWGSENLSAEEFTNLPEKWKDRIINYALVGKIIRGFIQPEQTQKYIQDILEMQGVRYPKKTLEKITNSIVSICIIEPDLAMGTGAFIAENIIVTNNHVVGENGSLLRIDGINGTKYSVEKIIRIPHRDIALIITKEKIPNPLKLSPKDTEEGEEVISLGFGIDPLSSLKTGNERTLTAQRGKKSFQVYEKKFEIDCYESAIDRGDSGGPILNINGNVVGINSATPGRNIGEQILDLMGKSDIGIAEKRSNILKAVEDNTNIDPTTIIATTDESLYPQGIFTQPLNFEIVEREFSNNNIALFIPDLSKIPKKAELMRKLNEFLKKILSQENTKETVEGMYIFIDDNNDIQFFPPEKEAHGQIVLNYQENPDDWIIVIQCANQLKKICDKGLKLTILFEEIQNREAISQFLQQLADDTSLLEALIKIQTANNIEILLSNEESFISYKGGKPSLIIIDISNNIEKIREMLENIK